MSKVAKTIAPKRVSAKLVKRAGGVAHRIGRKVPELSQEELEIFGGLTAQAGFTLANAEKIYKKT
jgi:hypothetical protein